MGRAYWQEKQSTTEGNRGERKKEYEDGATANKSKVGRKGKRKAGGWEILDNYRHK